MSINPEIAVEPSTLVSEPQPSSRGIGAGAVLIIGTWIGLIAGFCDLGFMVVIKRWIDRDFYHLGGDFPWIIPSGVTVLVLMPTLLIAVIAWSRGSVRLSVPVGLLSFVGFLDVCSRLRLEMWSTTIIAAGLALQSVRLVRPRSAGFVRFARCTVGLLVVILITTMLATTGRRMWSEYRQKSSLPPPVPGAQNVLLIVWDTVRAANTGLHGYARATTPNLERLASRGVRFDQAYSTSSWTLPAHASMFTGRWPHELGVNWKSPMRDDVPTLAGHLASHGYDTAGFVANLDYCSRETGLARGFIHYEDFPITVFEIFRSYISLGRRFETSTWSSSAIDLLVEKHTGHWYDLIPRSKEHAKSADAINIAFLGWLRERPVDSRPFFAFLNYNDAHSPYEVPDRSIPGFGLRPESSSQRQTLQGFTGLDKTKLSVDDVRMATDVYDDCISYLDGRLGSLLEELDQRGALENTLVIVTSDHGEHLGDHGLFFHGCSLYRQLVQVPLVIAGKKGIPAGRTIAEPVSLCDVPATVVDLLGLGQNHGFMGQSVARSWQPRAPEVSRVVPKPFLMETTKPELLTNAGREPAAKGPMKSVVAAGMHYIQMGDGSEELYNVNSDVEEKINLSRDAASLPVLLQFRNLLGFLLKKR